MLSVHQGKKFETQSIMSLETSYRSLVNQFERTKRELGEAESTIRRITGRDPDEVSNGVAGTGKYRGQSSFPSSAPGRASFSGRKRPAPFPTRNRSKERESSYDEESPDDEDSPHKKPALQSTVVAKSREGRSRKATIEEQNANSNIKERNKRMLYSIIGTIERFQHEEIKRQYKGSMRAEIEQKVEAATEEEKEKIRREKEHLFHTRREKQTQLRCLEKKIERAESHEVYDANYRHMQNFIMTKSKPPIFFLPSSHTPATKKCLEESRNELEELVKARKKHLDTDLSEIEGWYKKESLPGDKENKCPKEDGESQDVPETESESLVVEQEDTGPDDEDSNNEKNVGSLTDQDFEPIYD